MATVEEWVNRKNPDFFSSGPMALEHRWSKCIALEGNYIEKEEKDLNPEISYAGYLLARLRRYKSHGHNEIKCFVLN